MRLLNSDGWHGNGVGECLSRGCLILTVGMATGMASVCHEVA